jgi:hypothetical protein
MLASNQQSATLSAAHFSFATAAQDAGKVEDRLSHACRANIAWREMDIFRQEACRRRLILAKSSEKSRHVLSRSITLNSSESNLS